MKAAWLQARGITLVVALAMLLATSARVDAGQAFVLLDEQGPVDTPQAAQRTLEEASERLIANGGGVLVISDAVVPSSRNRPSHHRWGGGPMPLDGTEAMWDPVNKSQGVWRQPDPPAPARSWGRTDAVTLIDMRAGQLDIHVPQLSGMRLSRTFNLPEGQSSPHWSYHPMVQMTNSVIHGAVSYREWLREPVAAGTDRRFYVNTIRGVFPGVFLNAGDYSGVVRLYVKSVGYDREKQMPYFVADTDLDLRAGAMLHNKTHTNLMRLDTFAHTEDQTFDVMNWRRDYSQGDTYMFHAWFEYMGDVHSTAGDENGVLYASYVQSMVDPFHGEVATWNPQSQELVYTEARQAHTLGSGRPMINMNPDKWVAEGRMYIMQPGGAIIGWAGSIRSTDAPWGSELVGRYVAVDEPDEYVPGGEKVRRWYLITGFSEEDGIRRLSIQRHWWGAKQSQSITRLYNPANFTTQAQEQAGNPVLLRYIIAPGANVQDVSRGTRSGQAWQHGAAERTLVLSPGPHGGTDVDFAPGDPLEQAIGPDPFRPLPWRSWMFESVPGAWPAPIFDVANHGAIQRHAVMSVAGGTLDLPEARTRRHDHQPPWGAYVLFNSTAQTGIAFEADLEQAAILFAQRRNSQGQATTQGLAWNRQGGQTTMQVDDTGRLRLGGVPRLDLQEGSVTQLNGLSTSASSSASLRGLNVEVAAGSRQIWIHLPAAERDADYTVMISAGWLTQAAIVQREQERFAVSFSAPAPRGATLDWVLVR